MADKVKLGRILSCRVSNYLSAGLSFEMATTLQRLREKESGITGAVYAVVGFIHSDRSIW
ncbi:hypothetical protein [Argonema galeatum]|uniref:hypothetical protein n=1 Tax=Argonema galeatum TaxID=2942762 RepID=UPI002012C39E|nr:hypothetical protein [Argonema galeatum]MCL1467732.1 hypothetical protein [Argonema galeatum A003/A1]